MGDPTDVLRVTPRCAVIVPICLVAMLLPSSARAQGDGERLALSLRNNVVRIAVDRPGGERNGFGIIVGERGGRIYIATANHVVRGTEPQDIASRIRVRYYQRRDDEYPATLLGTSDARYDIAVLEAAAPPGLEWYRESLRARAGAERGTDVWFIGRAGGWYIPTQAGRLDRVTLDFRIHVDNLSVQVGSSGAPLLAADGILGMLLVDETTGTASALAIEIIERAVRLWDLPWELRPLTARAAIPSLAPEISMHLSAGDRFLQVGQFDRAIDEFQAARKYDARNTGILLRVAKAMRLSLWNRAGVPFELLPSVDQGVAASADSGLQVLYQGQGIDTSLQANPQWLLEESRLRRGRGDWKLALEALEKARKAAPADPDVISEMGLLLTRIAFDNTDAIPREQYTNGLDLLRRAVAARPADPLLRRHLAYGLELSDQVSAVRELDRAVTLPTGGDELLERNRRGAIRRLNWLLARFGHLQRRPWEDGVPAADIVRIAEYVRSAPNLEGSSQWYDWLDGTNLSLAAAYYELGNLTAAERVSRDNMRGKLEDVLGQRYGYEREGWSLVVLARVLERSNSDPATLLAIQMHLGKPNLVGAILHAESVGTSNQKAVLVDALTGGGIAQETGLVVDDAIVAVNGEVTPDVPTLARALARRGPGERVELAVIRKNTGMRLMATMPSSQAAAPGARLGIVVANIARDDASLQDQVLVRVTEVGENSPAARVGIVAGDEIVRLNGVPLSGLDHLIYVLNGSRPGMPVTVEIKRGDRTLKLVAPLAAAPPPSK